MKQSRRRVKIYFLLDQDEYGYPPSTSEFLWCIPTKRGTYVVDNIPFFVRGISLGDEISARSVGKRLLFSELRSKSAHSTLRVVFKTDGVAQLIREKLHEFGCGTELMESLMLLAVTMPPGSRIKEMLSFLDEQAREQNIGVEESAVRY
jgi:hypothetical protein